MHSVSFEFSFSQKNNIYSHLTVRRALTQNSIVDNSGENKPQNLHRKQFVNAFLQFAAKVYGYSSSIFQLKCLRMPSSVAFKVRIKSVINHMQVIFYQSLWLCAYTAN